MAVVARQLSTLKPTVEPVPMEIPPEPPRAPERSRPRARAVSRAFVPAARSGAPAASREGARAASRAFVPAARDVVRAEGTVGRSEPRVGDAAPAPVGFYGALAVDSEPSGARVFLNGRPVGSTPLLLERVPAGSRVVRVEADAYQPWSVAIRIVANEQTRIVATLKP